MDNKKIMLISLANGADHQRYIRILAEGLKKQYKLVLVCSEYNGLIDGDIEGVKIYKIKTPLKSSISVKMFSFLYLRNIYKIVREEKPKIIHFLSAHPYNLIMNIFAGDCKKVFSIHDVIPHPNEQKNIIIKIYNRIVETVSDYLVVYSKNAFNKLEINGKAVILPLCGREFKNNNRDDGFILFFGRIKPYKGLELLAEAIGKSNHKNYNIKFVIAGSGDASGYDLQKHNVELINRYIDNGELYDLIERCRAVILPYTSATQSGVIPLAYSFCKPVIITKIEGLTDMFIKDTGYVADLNGTDLTEKIKSICFDNSKYEFFKKNIELNYNKIYSKEVMLRRFDDFYRGLL